MEEVFENLLEDSDVWYAEHAPAHENQNVIYVMKTEN